jgi:myosin-5
LAEPNDKKKPGLFQKAMSLHQLRCGGVLETMRIAAAGFPTRWPFAKFCERYRILAPNLFDQYAGKWNECASALIKKIGLESHQFQMGVSKVDCFCCCICFFCFFLCVGFLAGRTGGNV